MPVTAEDVVDAIAVVQPPADAAVRASVLDARDSDPSFESGWLRVHTELTGRKEELTSEALERIEQIREDSFVHVMRSVDDPDFAAYVSDDFELFALAAFLGFESSWLNRYWNQYKTNGFGSPF